MSTSSRRQSQFPTVESSQGLFRKLEQEMQEGYLEVEITGLTLSRLLAAYVVMTRSMWTSTLSNLRSLLRPTPAL